MHEHYLRAVCAVAAAMLGLCPVGAAAEADAEPAKLEKQRAPGPREFASVFSFGYGSDKMPKDDAKFEQLLAKIKAGGFNVVHSSYTRRRLELCKAGGVKMMIDFLDRANHHVYKNVDGAKAVAAKVKGDPGVWGYNIWNESFGKMGPGRARDILNVRRWDPTHPAYCGTYRAYGMRHLVNSDVFGYYDYHWKRGPHYHFPHLMSYWQAAGANNSRFYRWVSTDSGMAGKGNFNRSLYTANTSIACGLKGILWFIGTRMMNPATLGWTTIGGDITKVNKEIMPLRGQLVGLGNPVAVYTTPITKTLKDRALPDGKTSMLPGGLEKHAFAKDFWIQPAGGQFIMGVFKDGQKRDAVFVANHNAYAGQTVRLKLARAVKVHMFSRKEGKWQPVDVADNTITFQLTPAGGELLRFEK